MKIKLYSAFLLSTLFSSAGAQQTDATSAALVSAFEAIGYEVVDAQGCEVAYMRMTQPSPQNNGYFALWRYLDLDSLRNLSQVEVYSIDGAGSTNFLVDLEFDANYSERYFPMLEFRAWVREEYPDSRWPYKGASSHDEYSAVIEFELHKQVEVVGTLNRSIAFSKYGPVTLVEATGTTIASRDHTSLIELLTAIEAYATENGCDVEL